MVFGKQTVADAVRIRHSGRRLQSVDTLEAEAEYVGKVTRDIVQTMASQEHLDAVLRVCRDAAGSTPIQDAEYAVEELAQSYSLNDVERSKVLVNLIEDRDYSKWGLANAVTKVANDLSSFERSHEIESMGSQILTMQLKQWDRIAA